MNETLFKAESLLLIEAERFFSSRICPEFSYPSVTDRYYI